MKKLIFLSLVFALVMMMESCEHEDVVSQSSVLKKSWTQSYEEKTSVVIEIYRPSDIHDFPPSRYRQSFIFDENDVCEYHVLAANDGHYMERGVWEYNEMTNIIKIFNSDLALLYSFEIVELTENLLELKVLN